MDENKEGKSNPDLEGRIAQYQELRQQISPRTGKELAMLILGRKDELFPLVFPGRSHSDWELKYHENRKEHHPGERGDAILKTSEYHVYTIEERDFFFQLEYNLHFGYFSDEPLSSGFRMEYYHSGRHQFGIHAPLSGDDRKIRELALRSMDHNREELKAIGLKLEEISGEK